MNDDRIINVAASVRQRLLNIAREQGEEYQLLLSRFAVERFLYRLSRSRYSDRFLIKGAMLFYIWQQEIHRPTRDLDLLSYKDSDSSNLDAIIREICIVETEDDGVKFISESVKSNQIRENEIYGGVRITLQAAIASAIINLQIDIGFGDVVSPKPQIVEFPSILKFPTAQLRGYSPESVVAEKLETMVKLGIANSRMKDFYDIWYISQTFSIKGEVLQQAISATFKRRKTNIPERLPLAFTREFIDDEAKNKQWNAFVKKGKLSKNPSFEEVVMLVNNFTYPILESISRNEIFNMMWQDYGQWKNK